VAAPAPKSAAWTFACSGVGSCVPARQKRRRCCGAYYAIAASSASKFRRQHAVGPYIVDFFCPRRQLALELDGGQHFEATTQAYDAERTDYLARRRITVPRFPNDQVLFQTEALGCE
jgi:hypothetical protein